MQQSIEVKLLAARKLLDQYEREGTLYTFEQFVTDLKGKQKRQVMRPLQEYHSY